MIDRRRFLKQVGVGSLVMVGNGFPLYANGNEPELTKITILHTNDVHSRIDPFPQDGGRNSGLGGAAKRASLIKQIRKQEKNVVLFDSGDIFQGTPYFNFFGGEIEIKLMSQMGYDAGTMGNHDFDAGIDGFNKQLPHANFPIVVSNYDFSNTVLNNKVKPYTLIEKDGIKIGVFGLGIELNSLVPKALYKETQYQDPIEKAQKYAHILKYEEQCDMVVCLSHLGFKYRDNKVSDHVIAENTEGIDLILGGHTHTFLKAPVIVENKNSKETIISQAGWAGILLGRIDITFEKATGDKCITCKNTFVK